MEPLCVRSSLAMAALLTTIGFEFLGNFRKTIIIKFIEHFAKLLDDLETLGLSKLLKLFLKLS